MNSLRQVFLRPSTAMRPRVERLDSRDCPSCTVFQRAEILTIAGDRLDNQVEIVASGDGSVRVTCDGSVRPVFTGVTQIDLKTAGGNDKVTAEFANVPNNFQFRADLGSG